MEKGDVQMKRAVSILICFAMIFSLASCRGSEEKENPTAATEAQPQYLCEADSGNVRVISMSAADGIFVEDPDKGKVEVRQVASIIVQNMSDRMLANAELWFRVNENEYATFIVQALPAGEKCVVMERTARTLNKDDKYTLDSGLCNFAYSYSTPEDKNVEVKTEGSTIRITNKTQSVLSTRITYRYYMNDMYYGGVAFSGEFKDIKPGETMEKTSRHFNNDCKIVGISDNLEENTTA